MSILPVSRSLIEQFNLAARLARQGSFEASLVAWDELLNEPVPAEDMGGVSGHFLAVVRMRRAWVLMDLGRMYEAREAFEAPLMLASLAQLGVADSYEWHFSYGNTLGLLGDIVGMERALGRALRIAAEDLHDLDRCKQTWRNRLAHAARAGAIQVVRRGASEALSFARNTRCRDLEAEAISYLSLVEVAPHVA